MAITLSSQAWQDVAGKNFEAQSMISQARKLKIYLVTVTFGAADDYVTGGVSIDLSQRGATKILAAMCTRTSIGVLASYIPSTKLLQLFETGAAADAVLDELASGDSATNSATFDFLVFAQ